MRLRSTLFAALFTCVAAASAAAQGGRAEVRVNAQLSIPDILILEEGSIETAKVGTREVTRAKVFVTANRQWALTVTASDPSEVRQMQVGATEGTTRTTGRSGNAMAVEVEVQWKTTAPTKPVPLIYNLAAH